MARGGMRPGGGRMKKVVDESLAPEPRKRGRPSNADRAARAHALAVHEATLTGGPMPPPLPPEPAKRPRGRPRKVPQAASPAPAAPPAAPAPAAAPVSDPGPVYVIKAPPFTPEMPLEVMPLDYLLLIMRDSRVGAERRDRAAQIAIGFTNTKPGEAKKGKKEERQENAVARGAPGSRFAPTRAPLAAVK